MTVFEKTLARMRSTPNNIRFVELEKICRHYFGEPRQNGTSHRVFRTPWAGDPRVNIQEGENGKAKCFQVKQVLQAIERLEASRTDTSGG